MYTVCFHGSYRGVYQGIRFVTGTHLALKLHCKKKVTVKISLIVIILKYVKMVINQNKTMLIRLFEALNCI